MLKVIIKHLSSYTSSNKDFQFVRGSFDVSNSLAGSHGADKSELGLI